VCTIKDSSPSDGPCIFTGKVATYFKNESYFDDQQGHIAMPNKPLSICDKTVSAINMLERNDTYISEFPIFMTEADAVD